MPRLSDTQRVTLITGALMPPQSLCSGPVAVTQPWIAKPVRKAGLAKHGLTILPNPWQNGPSFFARLQYLQDLQVRFAGGLADRLNRVHQTRFPTFFWEILANSWLEFFLHVLYDRYSRLRQGAAAFDGNVALAGLHRPLRPAADYTAFQLDYSVDEVKSLALVSAIARRMGIEVLPFETGVQATPRRLLNGQLPPPTVGPVSPPTTTLDGPMLAVGQEWEDLGEDAVAALGLSLYHPGNPEYPATAMDRSLLADLPARNAFERIAAELLPVLCPPFLLEHFPALLRLAEPLGSYQAYLTRSLWVMHKDYLFMTAAALGKTRGAKLLLWQPGGCFGQYRACPTEWWVLRTCDRFITWGWQGADAPAQKYLPLPQRHLTPLRDAWREAPGRAVWVSTSIPRHTYRLMPFPADCGHYPLYDRMRRSFLVSLTPEVRTGMFFRPYLWDWGWLEDERELLGECPELEIKCEGHIPDIFRDARMCVIDHLGTSMLYALAMNIPTILFWDPEYAPVQTTAQPFFDALRHAGILFDDATDAARQVNAVWSDITGWWRKPARQQARRTFVRQFCRGDADWLAAWREALARVLPNDRTAPSPRAYGEDMAFGNRANTGTVFAQS